MHPLQSLLWFGKTSQQNDINVNLRPGRARDRVLGWRVAMPVVGSICRYNLICSPGAVLACGNGGRERCTNNLRTRTPNLHFFLALLYSASSSSCPVPDDSILQQTLFFLSIEHYSQLHTYILHSIQSNY
jgi:hypothetical protein